MTVYMVRTSLVLGSDQTRPDRGKPDTTGQATSICTWAFAYTHHGLNFSAIGTFGHDTVQYSIDALDPQAVSFD
jgi:hypothetical protein